MLPEFSQTYDVIVVGGGPAGASAAIRLAGSGARVLLAEQKSFPRPKLCGEFISPECLTHFAQLGVGEQMRGAGGAWITETKFYAPSGKSLRVPSAWLGANQALGLSRAEMDELLLRRAQETGVEVRENTAATGLVVDESGVVRGVRLKSAGQTCSARATLTVDATGRASALARHVAARRVSVRRAPLVAFKAHFADAGCAPGACEIYFYRGGYGGLNRVEGGASNLCFIVAARDVRAAGSDVELVLRNMLASHRRAAEALAGARRSSEWLSVALDGFGRRELVPAVNLISIGDAASFIDPFTGSGMLMALESGEIAARVIAGWWNHARQTDFDILAEEYRKQYSARFSARLRYCALLRRAAFAPNIMAEAAVRLLGASESLRRRLARATRHAENPAPPEIA